MRLLADENIPRDAIRALRAAGHDVFSASESVPGSSDDAVLSRADGERRLVLTFDRDFGELAARQQRGAAGGILLLRLVPTSAAEVSDLLVRVLLRPDVVWSGRLSVVDRAHIRQRVL